MTKIIKIFMLFALFSRAESVKSVTDLRVRWELSENDVGEIARKSGDIEEFQKILKKEYTSLDYWIYEHMFASFSVNKARIALKRMKDRFMIASQSYVRQYLFEYCELALLAIELKTKERDTRELIGFLDDQDYCVFTALYDSEIDVHWSMEMTLFFSTITRDDAYSIGRLKEFLNTYYYRLAEHHESVDFERVESRLNEIKLKIRNFSNSFCARWTPFLSHRLVAELQLDGFDIGNPFVQYVFNREKCAINFVQSDNEESHPNRITWWKCENILESPEYRYEKYEEDVSIQMCLRQPLLRRDRRIEQGSSEYSMAALKHELKSNIYYLNFVKYYNIVSKVMLLVSIKEGLKIFKGIKQVVVTMCCKEQKEKDFVKGIRGPMSALSKFKAVFGRFVSILLFKKRISLANDLQKKTFDYQVKKLMTLLEIRDNRMANQIPDICRVISEELLTIVKSDAHLGLNPNQVKFEGYYFQEPLFNISKLYHYIANYF